MKTCIACKHFDYSLGSQGYSELTPGSPGCADCSKGHGFDFELDDLLTKAQDCPDFELSDLARSKGWE